MLNCDCGSGDDEDEEESSQKVYMLGHKTEMDDAEKKDVGEFLKYMGVMSWEKESSEWTPCSEDGTFVFVFSRAKDEHGGEIDTDLEVEDPMTEMRKIFPYKRSTPHVSTKDAAFPEFQNGPVSCEVFCNTIRYKLLQILAGSGINISQQESVDKDEVFVKAWMDLKGPVIRAMAEQYRWTMPFKRESYEDFKQTDGLPPRNCPLLKGSPEEVLAYTEYQPGHANKLQQFKRSDEIKLMWMFLNEWVDLQQLAPQPPGPKNAVKTVFVMYNARESAGFDNEWGSFWKACQLPSDRELDKIREHFGDEIALFWMWLNNFVRHIAFLAMMALMAFLGRTYYEVSNPGAVRSIQAGFTAFLFFWTPWMFGAFKTTAARKMQKWDSDGASYNAIVMKCSNYKPNVSRHWRRFSLLVSGGTTVSYLMFCISLVTFIRYSIQSGNSLEKLGDIMTHSFLTPARVTTVLILLLNLGWAYAVVPLTNLENHRLQRQMQQSLAVKLSFVKICLALYPLVYVGLLQKYTTNYCASSYLELAGKIYNPGNMTVVNDTVPWQLVAGGATEVNLALMAESLKEFPPESHHAGGNNSWFCKGGCYPVPSCPSFLNRMFSRGETVPPGQCSYPHTMRTNCVEEVSDYLQTYFITYVLIDLIFLAYPRFMTWWQQHTELAKAGGKDWKFPLFGWTCPSRAALLETDAKSSELYTYDEVQAKNPIFSYNEWGGGPVDDFLEFAIMFAIVLSFGVVLPLVFVLAFLAFLVMYRLMANRFVYITRRPYPVGAKGIDVWIAIFDAIIVVSVITNTMMGVFMMYPGRLLEWRHQLLAFFVSEHVMMGVWLLVHSLHPEVPVDVEEVSRKNQAFLATHQLYHTDAQREKFEAEEFDRYNNDHIDIMLKGR